MPLPNPHRASPAVRLDGSRTVEIAREAIARFLTCRSLDELISVLLRRAGRLLPNAHMTFLRRRADRFESVDGSSDGEHDDFQRLLASLHDTGRFAQALQQGVAYAREPSGRIFWLQRFVAAPQIDGMILWIDREIPHDVSQTLGLLVDLAATSVEFLLARHAEANWADAPSRQIALQDARHAVERFDTELLAPDQLTGLASRAQFVQFLQHALQSRTQAEEIGIILLDINGFHRVNREFGCDLGDRVLCDVAQYLLRTLRTPGGDRDERHLCVARTSADEFGLAFARSIAPLDLPALAASLHVRLADWFRHDTLPFDLTISSGSSWHDTNESMSLNGLLRCADLALKRAKLAGRNQHARYDPTWEAERATSLRIESLLRDALHLDRFQLHFQPVFRLADGALAGAEALLRLSVDGVPLSPAQFIPIAEQSGQIVAIGEWVWRQACRQLRAWDALGVAPIPFAINLSAIE